MLKTTSKISAALTAILMASALVSQADAHTGRIGSGHSASHSAGARHIGLRHYSFNHHSFRHHSFRHYSWRHGYRGTGVTIVGEASRSCPVGYHLGYLGKHCWKTV